MNLKISAALFGALVAALGLLAPANQPNPIEAARLNNLGCAYMNQQLFEKALKSFQQAQQADPKFAIARLNEGVAYLNLQKVDEAKSALEDAIKQEPKSPNAWYSLGLLAKNSGDAQDSINAFKRVTEIDPNDADTWYFLGSAYAQAKQFPQAIESFQHALKINPLHASAEFGLSRAYQQSGEPEQAREQLKRFQYITQNKIGSPMSLAYGEQGQYSRAVESPQAQLKPPAQIKVQFVDVTKELGISFKEDSTRKDPTGPGPGACFLDYDNDGKIDLFLPGTGAQGGMTLYHNLGNGRFEDVTRQAGLDPVHRAFGCTAGDYDNDGFTDLAIITMKSLVLLHNEHGYTFNDVTGSAVPGTSISGTGLTFVDYDHDGDLDLFVGGTFPICEPGFKGVCNVATLLRNNGNGTFTDVSEPTGVKRTDVIGTVLGSDFNNDRAIDLVVAGPSPFVFENPREGSFIIRTPWNRTVPALTWVAESVLDFDHDGWMDVALTRTSTQAGESGLSLWRNNHGKSFEQVKLPETNWARAFGVATFDYDNDGWVDLVAVGETKEGKGEIKLFRNLGPDGFKDVTTDVGLDKIHLDAPRAIITGDYDNDGATDLLITQNHGPAVLLRNEGGNQNHWLRLALKGLNDNKSAIGTKVEVFSGGNRQKFEIYGSNGYLGQNSPYLTVGLGDAKEADIVRMLWPTGVLQDEIQVAGDKQQDFIEIDRRGSSCPTLFAWNGERYEFVADMLGAAVVGHWVGPGQRDIPRPVEYIKIPYGMVREKDSHVSQNQRDMGHPSDFVGVGNTGNNRNGGAPLLAGVARSGNSGTLSFRFMEPLEEAVYLDQVRLFAVDHPAGLDVYPNEYFASNPPYPEFKVVVSRDARPPAAVRDEHAHDLLPDLLAHRYVGDFALTQFQGFAKPHTLTLDLGESYNGGPLWLLMHGEIEYFTANSMYAASQAGLEPIAPYVEALSADGKWKRVMNDMGFPAGGPRTMTADLTGKLPQGTRQIRITTNLQVYWDSILINRTAQVAPPSRRLSRGRLAPAPSAWKAPNSPAHVRAEGEMPSAQPAANQRYLISAIPLVRADLEFHGYPYKIEGTPPGNVRYLYEKTSATGPYTRPMGTYTRYGDVLSLLTATDDKLAVFGSGDEVRLDFDPSRVPPLPRGWVRDYFFAANGYEKDMDFYAADGNFVAPLPFLGMGEYPYPPKKTFPLDDAHLKYLLEYNTRHMSGKEQRGYWFDYEEKR
jgi:tetratricopeptide (TPR) repeat protein